MTFFKKLVSAAETQCYSFFVALLHSALQMTAEDLQQWNTIDPVDLGLDPESDKVFCRRVEIPIFAMLTKEVQFHYLSDATKQLAISSGASFTIFAPEDEAHFVVYITDQDVRLDAITAAYEDAESYAEPAHDNTGLAELTLDDINFLENLRVTQGLSVFDDITFSDEDFDELEDFFVAEGDVELLNITVGALEALRAEYDTDVATTSNHLSLVPRVSVQEKPVKVDTVTPDPVGTDVMFDDAAIFETEDVAVFEAENEDEDEDIETAEQDELNGVPDNSAEEAFIDEVLPVDESKPAVAPAVTDEVKLAHIMERMQVIADSLPSDTISQHEAGGTLLIMYTRVDELKNTTYDAVVRVSLRREQFAGREVDMFFIHNEAGVQLARAPSPSAIVNAIATM